MGRAETDFGQLKKCVWAGCLYIIEDDLRMEKPLSPKLMFMVMDFT